MLYKYPVSENTGIVTKNVAKIQLRKVRIIGPQRNKKTKAPTKTKIDTIKNIIRSNIRRKKDTSVRNVQNRKIGI